MARGHEESFCNQTQNSKWFSDQASSPSTYLSHFPQKNHFYHHGHWLMVENIYVVVHVHICFWSSLVHQDSFYESCIIILIITEANSLQIARVMFISIIFSSMFHCFPFFLRRVTKENLRTYLSETFHFTFSYTLLCRGFIYLLF